MTVWDAERGIMLRRLRGHRDFVAALAFSPNGRTLYSGSYDRTVRAWTDLEADPAPNTIALPPRVEYTHLAPGGRFAGGMGEPNTVWTMRTLLSPMIQSRQTKPGGDQSISPDGRWMVAGHWLDDVCEMWRYKTDQFVPHSTHQAIGSISVSPAFSQDGRLVAMLATNGVLAVWELEPWRELARWKGLESGPNVNAILFDPPGKRIFVRCQNFDVFATHIDTGRLIPMPKARKAGLSGMDISPDNRVLGRLELQRNRGPLGLCARRRATQPRSGHRWTH